MKRIQAGPFSLILLCAVLLLSCLAPSYSYADEGKSVADALKSGGISSTVPNGQQSGNNSSSVDTFSKTSGWNFVFQVIFSLGLIVVLIYVLLRFLGNKQLGNLNQNGPFKVLSSLPLGNGKTLQIVMIADSLYILGIGNDVQLIRHIPNGEEADLILSEIEMSPANQGFLFSLFPFLKKRDQQEQDFIVEHQQLSGTFEQLLEQKWDEVKQSQVKTTNWTNRNNNHRGEDL